MFILLNSLVILSTQQIFYNSFINPCLRYQARSMIVLTHVFYTFTPCSPGTTLFINLFTINLKLPPRFLPCLYKVITLYYPYIITIITSLQSIPTYVVVGSTLGLESPLFYSNLIWYIS